MSSYSLWAFISEIPLLTVFHANQLKKDNCHHIMFFPLSSILNEKHVPGLNTASFSYLYDQIFESISTTVNFSIFISRIIYTFKEFIHSSLWQFWFLYKTRHPIPNVLFCFYHFITKIFLTQQQKKSWTGKSIMVHPCIVSDCKNKAKDGIYRFPRDAELRKSWLKVQILIYLV